MATAADEALRKAAERAKRRVEIEVAKNITGWHLGYELAPEQFPWVSLSMPYYIGGLSIVNCMYACMHV